jgi:hypothetical protein
MRHRRSVLRKPGARALQVERLETRDLLKRHTDSSKLPVYFVGKWAYAARLSEGSMSKPILILSQPAARGTNARNNITHSWEACRRIRSACHDQS